MARIRFKLEFVAEVPDGLRSLPSDPLAIVIDGVRHHATEIEPGAKISYRVAAGPRKAPRASGEGAQP